MAENGIKTEQIQEFIDFLMGISLPDGIIMPEQPCLVANSAFNVIWFLQEHMHVLPEKFEICKVCHMIFNSCAEGFYLDDQYYLKSKILPKKYWGHYCDGCVPTVDFYLG